MNKLKKCPFCGGDVEFRGGLIFHCFGCGVNVNFGNIDGNDAVKKWNTRIRIKITMLNDDGGYDNGSKSNH